MAAFTLVELLVVLGIVGLLAALSFPAMSRMQEKGKLTRKLGNLRQIWVAHGMYVSDNNQRIVPVQDYVNGERVNWRSLLAKYVLAADSVTTSEANKVEVFLDPFFKNYDPDKASGTRTGYAMNTRPGLPDDDKQNAHWNAAPQPFEREFRTFQLTDLSRRIFLADSDDEWFYNVNSKPPAVSLTMNRHGGKGMALMYDGSTQLLTQEQAATASTKPRELDVSRSP